VSEVYELIAATYANDQAAGTADAPTITAMCAWVEVSTSGFYEWRGRPPSATAQRRERLKTTIAEVFAAFDGTYGYRRVHVELLRAGTDVSAELVRTLMRELGLVACQPRPYKTTTTPGEADPATPDLVARDFTADAPGDKLVGDITYIPTWQGWVYLATVIDCFNREVIGYALADHMRAGLVCDALDMAARNHNLSAGCIFHSDRGSQYTSAEFAATLTNHKMRQSLGRTGVCYDNALAESFNAALKVERVYRTAYPTRKDRDDRCCIVH
jgi:transposase InsO family protein